MSKQSFRELGVSPDVVAVLAANSIDQPFRIQELVLPDALAGLDVLARAPTGSGKTLAFALPIVEASFWRLRMMAVSAIKRSRSTSLKFATDCRSNCANALR